MTRRGAACPSWALLAGLILATGCGGSSVEPVQRVVVVTLDTTRADHLGPWGETRGLTPHLDALAAESTIFLEAVSPAPTTLPSHASLFTGLYPTDHGVRYNLFFRLDEQALTLAELLRDRGFSTAAFPASRIVSKRFGLDQGFDHWVDPPEDDPGANEPYSGGRPVAVSRTAGEGVDLALDWLEGQGDAPAFVWLHFYDPHWPYEAPFPHSAQHDDPYAAEIAYMDAQFGRLLDALRADPRWDRTLVVVAADHGEGLHEHNEAYHSVLVYEETQHIPMFVRAPGVDPRRIEEPVSLVDVMPTVLDLVGAKTDAPMRGASLRPAIERGAEPERRDIYFESITGALVYGWAELEGVRYGDWKLIESLSPELFDLAADPEEADNVVGLHPDRAGEMRLALERFRVPLTEEVAAGAEKPLDAENEKRLSSLGYVAGATGAGSGANAPNPRDLVHLQQEILTAQTALGRGDWRVAAPIAEYVMEQDPGNRWGMMAMANVSLSQQNLDEALHWAQMLAEASPTSAQSWIALGRVYNARGEAREAFDALDRGLAEVPDDDLLAYLRLVAAFDADRDDVCSALVPETLAEEGRADPRLLLLDARCALRAGRDEEALDILETAIDRGFRRVDLLETAPDFERVAAGARFRELLARAEREREGGDGTESGNGG